VRLTFHPRVQRDLDEALEYYFGVREGLADDFWDEAMAAFDEIAKRSMRHHFDSCGMRRKNLQRFPYHVLYEILPGRVRIMVVRHDRRDPRFGLRRQ